MKSRSYIPVRSSQIRYYSRVPLYYETAPDVFQLYKPAGHGDLRHPHRPGHAPAPFHPAGRPHGRHPRRSTRGSTSTSPAASKPATSPR
ncbi:MAG: hypothetical protein MZU91_07295 [Desulfosudis oleivorans]|nr:hypothetical protein [Desulfosudis oleivorans]